MLLLVLILVLLAFGLLVAALLTGSVLAAWISVGLSVVAAVALAVDWVQRRSAVKAGAASMAFSAAEAERASSSEVGAVGPHVPEPATEILPVVPTAERYSGPVVTSGETGEPDATVVAPTPDLVDDNQPTVMMPAVEPSGSPSGPPGADDGATASGASSSPSVINSGADAIGEESDEAAAAAGAGGATVVDLAKRRAAAVDARTGGATVDASAADDTPEAADSDAARRSTSTSPEAVDGVVPDEAAAEQPAASDAPEKVAVDEPGAPAAEAESAGGDDRVESSRDGDASPSDESPPVASSSVASQSVASQSDASSSDDATGADQNGAAPTDDPTARNAGAAVAFGAGAAAVAASATPASAKPVERAEPPGRTESPERAQSADPPARPGVAAGESPTTIVPAATRGPASPPGAASPPAASLSGSDLFGGPAAADGGFGPARRASAESTPPSRSDAGAAARDEQPARGQAPGGDRGRSGADAPTRFTEQARGDQSTVYLREEPEPPLSGEPPEESAEPAATSLVASLADEVIVIDEQPRYHVPGCRALSGQPPFPLPAREAVELGFSPCGWCSPNRTLAARHPATAR